MSDEQQPVNELAVVPNHLLVRAFITSRTMIETEEEALSVRLKGTKMLMVAIEQEMLARSIREKTNSFATEAGTCYKSVIKQAKVKNPDAFFTWLYEQGLEVLKGFVTAAVSKDAVYEYVGSHNVEVETPKGPVQVPHIPPGIELGGVTKMNFKSK